MSEETQNGPGAELKAAREGMDVSTREVADALNLPVNVIEALEADDFERLPPTVFTRGYLRSYARLLELSPESLLARYPEVTEEVDAITGEMAAVEPAGLPPTRMLTIAGAVGVILIALLVWLLGDDETTAIDQPAALEVVENETGREEASVAAGTTDTLPPAVETSESEPTGFVSAPAADDTPAADETPAADQTAAADRRPVLESAPIVPQPQTDPRSDPEVIEEDRIEAVDAAVIQNETVEQISETDEARQTPIAEVADETPPAPSYRERRITEFGEDEITFVFSEDCWVEVKSETGENLYSDLNRTGRTLVLTGRAPFRVLLGYAPGVSLSFNGEPVELARYSRNNVANLVLGE